MRPSKSLKTTIVLLLLYSFGLNAQEVTQVLRGKIVDVESQFPLIGVNAFVTLSNGEMMGATSDLNGDYRIDHVPLGRQTVKFSYLGYSDVISNIIVNSGKEVILNIKMEESITDLEIVEVVAQKDGEVRNEMALISAKQFSVEETNRYAGSRGDPGRMASNFAGVQGADDSRNDIVIRGNSPQGVLWRLDGFNIPNPNHFAIPGTGGGPVTILNNKFLSNSDFFTGAFPAEFGNSIAGAFDLKMRNGNNEKYEFSGQFGFLGTELMAEGPISKKNHSSFLATYRYSTLSLFEFLGIKLGTDAVPQYQDAAFRVNLPQKKGGNIALFGIGGNSKIGIVLSEEEAPNEETLLFGSNDRDQYFTSRMGIIGMTYTKPVNPDTYFKVGLAASNNRVDTEHDYIVRHIENEKFVVDSLPNILDYFFDETKYSAYFFVNKKLGKKHTIKFGVNADLFHLVYNDSVRVADGDTKMLSDWRTRWDANQNTTLLQPYLQYKLKFSDKLVFTAGLTSLYYSVNKNSLSPVEPRIGLSYQINPLQKISFGAGIHSQIQSNYVYFYGAETIGNDPQEHNLDLGLTKSNHIVLGYDIATKKNIRFKIETYFQYLTNIPVETHSSSFSLVNAGAGFSRFFPDTLTNEGTGTNYGLEFTIEKAFTKGYYFLLTTSLFDSKYKGSDGVIRNTSFNGNYAANALFAKEFTFKNSSALNIGGKVTYAGGRWYGPVDKEESAKQLEIIYVDETVNTIQFKPYFRADVKISFKWNRPKMTHEFSIDLVNVFNTKNILTLTYAPDHPSGDPIREEYQLGFLPIFYYRLDF